VLNRVHDEIMTDNISIDDGIKEMNAGVAHIK
jgi:multiple sugar transport system substrate-binding protein